MAKSSSNGYFFFALFIILGFIIIRTVFYNPRTSTTMVSSQGYSSIINSLDSLNLKDSISPIINNAISLVQDFQREPIDCDDMEWCTIEAPTKSYFRFPDAPSDEYRWRQAQSQAASGDQVLLKGILRVFDHHMNFLDGDILFRKYHMLADFFLDHNSDLSSLSSSDLSKFGMGKNRKKEKTYSYESWYKLEVLPPQNYDFKSMNRSAIVQLGYNAFSRANKTEYFEGGHVGMAEVQVPHLVRRWKEVERYIDHPVIFVHAGNENWGFFSTEFPNRTVDWAKCCDNYPDVQRLLDHHTTALFVTNQHHNLTHPKLISFPRGMPIYLPHRRKYLFDIMHKYAESLEKKSLIFASNSNWKHRPYVSQCIAQKFTPKELEINHYDDKSSVEAAKKRMGEKEYFEKIASSRTSICLAGLGYDSFRLWETLTMGTVAVLEKGTGLDKTLWKLPALLVDDFDEVTPELLRAAYVEAIYRANNNEFEFERLTQSFWYSFVMKVSRSTEPQAVIDSYFPPASEDPTFTRPKVMYSCGENMELCGPGTKRPPRTTCGGQPKGARRTTTRDAS